MVTETDTPADPQAWRLQTPGHDGWPHNPRPGDPNKYFMVTVDSHVSEPADLWVTRIDKKYRHRLPRIEVDEHGEKWQVAEGYRPNKIRDLKLEGDDLERGLRGTGGFASDRELEWDIKKRLEDHARDGIDAETIYPNKGLAMWATPDPVFSMAMCRVYNEWVWEIFAQHNHRMAPMACIASGDIDVAIAEIQRVAQLGFRGLTLPAKPVWGGHDPDELNYNDPVFDRLWAVVEETALPITFHVSTGRDPRSSHGRGGAIINMVVHSFVPTTEPLVQLCASGVLERYPGIRFATIEAGIGWLPWLLKTMDEGARMHHMYAYPKLQALPSEYFRRNGFASFQEDEPGIDLARKYNLIDNLIWANDYPHQEGLWPHSAPSIERTMGPLTDDERAKVLGGNAARLFGFTASR